MAVFQSISPVAPAELDSDAVLLSRVRNGDPVAGDILVRRYHVSLLRYLTRITGNAHVAEELNQQSWVSVLEHADKFDPSNTAGGFKAWLFRIATNKANDSWRAKGRDRDAKTFMRLAGSEEFPDASARLEVSDEAEKLRGAIAKLPENQRQILMLRYYSEMKFTDIAQMLGCPLNTALGRMHKAMLKLKQLMACQ